MKFLKHGQELFLSCEASRLFLGPTQPPIHWVPMMFSLVLKQLAQTTHLHPVPKLRMSGVIPPPHWMFLHGMYTDQVYLHCSLIL